MKTITNIFIISTLILLFFGCAQAADTNQIASVLPSVTNPSEPEIADPNDTATPSDPTNPSEPEIANPSEPATPSDPTTPPELVIYTVLFNTNGGFVNETGFEVVEGETIPSLPTPLKEGNAFIGWYIDEFFTIDFLPSTPITSSIVLFAKWSEGTLPAENYIPNGDSYIVSDVATSTKGDVVIAGTYNGKQVTAIDDKAFAGCSGITSVVIPETVTSIGNDAFNWCINLKSVEIPESVTTIGNSAFRYCHKLESVTIPNSVETIGTYAFATCYALKEVTIGESVKTIADYAFTKCTSLETVVIPNSVESIGYRAFDGCSALKTVGIGSNVGTISAFTFLSCDSLEAFDVADSNTTYKSVNGDLYSKDGKALYQYAAGKADKTFIFLPETERVEYRAFWNADTLEKIFIPQQIHTIGEYAFVGCSNLEIHAEISEESKPRSSGYLFAHTGWHSYWAAKELGSNYKPSMYHTPIVWESTGI